MYLVGQKGSNGYGYRSTAEEVAQGIDASSITAIVTGVTSGLGEETARVLALQGAHVYLAGRKEEAVEKCKDKILQSNPKAKLSVLAPLDLSSQKSVREAAKRFLALDEPLNLLVNNAGIMMCPWGQTEDGIELQIGTNFVGHYLLTKLLLEKLKETADKTGIESRIVDVSSRAIRWVPETGFPWETLGEQKGYDTRVYYALSKLALVYHAEELSRQLKAEGVTNVTVNSLHPGTIATGLQQHSQLFRVITLLATPFLKSIPQGSATSIYVALHPNMQGTTGKFFVDCNEEPLTMYSNLGGDEQAAKKLFQLTEGWISKMANA